MILPYVGDEAEVEFSKGDIVLTVWRGLSCEVTIISAEAAREIAAALIAAADIKDRTK